MSAGLDVFDNTLEKTNALLSNIEVELGWENHRHQTYQVLRAVLHTLRDRLPVSEAANLAAQMPILLRGVFYEGWKPEEVPIKMNLPEFLEQIRCKITLDLKISILDLSRIVIGQLFYIIDPLEQQKIRSLLPEEYSEIFEDVDF